MSKIIFDAAHISHSFLHKAIRMKKFITILILVISTSLHLFSKVKTSDEFIRNVDFSFRGVHNIKKYSTHHRKSHINVTVLVQNPSDVATLKQEGFIVLGSYGSTVRLSIPVGMIHRLSTLDCVKKVKIEK